MPNLTKSLRTAFVAAAVLPVLLGVTLPAPAEAGKHLPYYVVMDPPIVYPGAIVRLQVRPPAGATGGSVAVAGRRYLGEIDDGMFVAYFAVDIDTLPGPYELSYAVGSRRGKHVVTVRARRMDDEARGGARPSREDLIVEDLVRSHPRLVSLWNRTTLERYWGGAFVPPSRAPMRATFAMRKATENKLGAPHTGVDLAVRSGGNVVSSGTGSVVLVADGPGARIVVVDHGFGLYTYYFGLGEVFVEEGARVRNGALLGRMPLSSPGMLHFGARLGGAEVDPVSLPGITLRVPPIRGERRAPKEEKDRTSDYDF